MQGICSRRAPNPFSADAVRDRRCRRALLQMVLLLIVVVVVVVVVITLLLTITTNNTTTNDDDDNNIISFSCLVGYDLMIGLLGFAASALADWPQASLIPRG